MEIKLKDRVKDPNTGKAGTIINLLPGSKIPYFGVRWENGDVEQLYKCNADNLVNLSQPLTRDDVWGVLDLGTLTWEHRGMVVAQGKPGTEYPLPDVKGPAVPTLCPIFDIELPYKSVTVVCYQEQVNDVIYWLEYVHGSGAVEKEKNLEGGKVALLSSYKCW